MDRCDDVFRLKEDLPQQALHESIRTRLRQLRALATVMEGKDFYVHPPAVMQAYAWTLVDVIDEVQALSCELRERRR
jgi:hypothetical protein